MEDDPFPAMADARSVPSHQTAERESNNRRNPRTKRRRTALACSSCRHRKSRCDGKRPKCSLCHELGLQCEYEQPGSPANLTVGRAYLERLEKRLQDIESTLKELQEPKNAANIGNGGASAEDKTAHNSEQTGIDDTGIQSTMYSSLYQSGGEIREVDNAEDSIDGMGAIKFTDEEDRTYFGPSSNIAFLRHISLALARTGGVTGSFSSTPTQLQQAAGGMSTTLPHHVQNGPGNIEFGKLRGSVNIYALPSEERTWTLIREYFQKTGHLLPFVHEESFCATYFEMKKSNFTMARRTWLGLLNIVLALATTLYVEAEISAESRIEESDMYYQRANGLCDRESRGTISPELVQYFLILGQYLQGTQKSVQAWTVHGLAITTAFQLGLHSPKMNKAFPVVECEIRNRIWWGCVLLDRTLSMTFGRPPMIPDRYVKVDMPNPSLQILGSTAAATPSLQPDGLYYIANIKLYNAMYKIIDTCYGQNLGLDDENQSDLQSISMVLKGEEMLEEWKSQLVSLNMYVTETPIDSRYLESIEQHDKIMERYKIVLSIRYHNLQILLHRPVLERLLDSSGCSTTTINNTSMKQQIELSSVERSVKSAITIIATVHIVVMSTDWRRGLLGAWNFALFYTFNAGLVIFAAMHVARSQLATAPTQSAQWDFLEHSQDYFNMAIEALRNIDQGNRVVERCVSYLSQLNLPSIGNAYSETSHSTPIKHSNSTVFQSADAERIENARSNPSLARILNPTPALRQVPMDIDFNEFMLETDLSFLDRSFNILP